MGLAITSAGLLWGYVFAGGSYQHCYGATTLAHSTDYRLSMSYDPATATMRVLVNGVVDGTTTSVPAPADNQRLAPTVSGLWGGGGRSYGIVDDPRIYSHPLSAAADLAEYNAGLTGSGPALAMSLARTLSDAAGVTDTPSPVKAIERVLADGATVADVSTPALAANRALADSAGIVDLAAPAVGKARVLADTALITDGTGPAKGVNSSNAWYMPDLDQDRENALLVAAGTEWVRFQIEWDDVLTSSSSSYYWTTYDEAILNATSAGMKVLITVLNTPAWARSGGDVRTPPTLDSDYAAICATMADRWDGTGGQGRIDAIQVWNEPNNGTRFWTGTVAKYTSMAIAAYDAVKAVRPEVKVGTCVATLGLSNFLTWLQDMYAGGIEGKQDFVGIHVYTTGGTPTADAQFARFITLHDEMVAQGDPAEAWITEFGWNTSGLTYNGADIWQGGNSEATVAAYIDAAWQIFAFYPWVKQAFYYMARDYDFGAGTPESYFGLMETAATSASSPPAGTLKEGYDAWSTLSGGGPFIETGKGATVADTANVTDALATVAVMSRALADTANVTDSATPARAIARTLADSAGITDAVATLLVAARTLADAAGITDSTLVVVGLARTQADAAGIVDAFAMARAVDKQLADAADVADATSAARAFVQELADSGALADVSLVERALGLVIADTAVVSDGGGVPSVIASSGVPAVGIYGSVGTITATHDPGAGVTPRAVVVQVAQHAGGTDQITGITYGGVPMTELRVDIQTAGNVDPVVYTYVLTDGIPSGSQTVAMTTTGTNQKAGRVRSIAAPGRPWLTRTSGPSERPARRR